MTGARELRSTFDAVADLYETARTSYPEELFDDVVTLAELKPGARLLEIGCATGKATRPLLERGLSVMCVEMGPHLARRARAALAGLPFEVQVSAFEAWEGPPAAYDLVFAATAWHWIDPAIGYAKAHDLLRKEGHLALWNAQHAFPPGFDPFFSEIQEVYNAIGESHAEEWPPPSPEEVPDRAEEIEASGLFDDVQVRRYVWGQRYSVEKYIDLLKTFSGHIAMDEAKRQHLFDEIRHRISHRSDPTVTRHWLAILHVARPRPR